jgi:hypothetical protein
MPITYRIKRLKAIMIYSVFPKKASMRRPDQAGQHIENRYGDILDGWEKKTGL